MVWVLSIGPDQLFKWLESAGSRQHHLFAWPAFALIVGLAVWRASAVRFAAQAPGTRYLAVTAAAVVLVLVAGYWGGEMLLAS